MDTSPHTIAALSTPPGRGALAVIRLTGDAAQSVFAGVIREVGRFEKQIARQIGLYTVISDCHHSSYNYCPDAVFGVDNGQNRQNTAIGAAIRPVNVDNSVDVDNLDNVVAAAPGRPLPVDVDNSPDIIDEVTAIKYNAPHSFTGEDMVEIFCHGGAVITGKILDRLFRMGARPAGRGEFSRRAFVNGKIGLLKAESIAGLIESQTEMRLHSAQLAYRGKQAESLERLRRSLINTLADIESRIEFGEDDDVAESRGELISANRRELETIIAELEEELRRGDRVRVFDDGIAVALAGPANAGKSSLFNEILGYGRSIVHDRPGTTRDIVSERIAFEGVPVKLFDSAGIRDTADAVEQQGIERTMSAVRGAHIVLWVTAANEQLDAIERKGIFEVINNVDNVDVDNINPSVGDTDSANTVPVGTATCRLPLINVDNPGTNVDNPNKNVGATAPGRPPVDNILVVINKMDISSSNEKKQFCEDNSLKYIETSLTEKINIKNLFNAISKAIHSVTDDIPVPQIIINERHRDIIVLIIKDLRESVDNFDREEVAAYCLKSSLGRLEEFCGHVAGDEILDEIFGKFCIGK